MPPQVEIPGARFRKRVYENLILGDFQETQGFSLLASRIVPNSSPSFSSDCQERKIRPD